MKVAITLTTRWWRGSIDHDGYAEALKKLKHEPILICLGNDAGEASFPVIVPTVCESDDIEYWRSLRIDVAIVWNWLRGSKLVDTLRSAGIRCILRADTDGLCSSRVFPVESLIRTVGNGVGFRSRIGLAKYFFANRLPHARQDDLELMATIERADAVVVETPTARRSLLKVFDKYGQNRLATKITVVPHSVREEFIAMPGRTATSRKRQIIAAGRWDSMQKNPELLVETLKDILSIDPSVTAMVCGPIKEQTLQRLKLLGEQICYLGIVGTKQMIELLSESRILLSTSRWETQPIGALEAVCLGCTIVAPPIRGFVDLMMDPNCGTMARFSNAKSLASAVRTELTKWDAGDRSPKSLADAYRSRFSNATVVAAILNSLRSPIENDPK